MSVTGQGWTAVAGEAKGMGEIRCDCGDVLYRVDLHNEDPSGHIQLLLKPLGKDHDVGRLLRLGIRMKADRIFRGECRGCRRVRGVRLRDLVSVGGYNTDELDPGDGTADPDWPFIWRYLHGESSFPRAVLQGVSTADVSHERSSAEPSWKVLGRYLCCNIGGCGFRIGHIYQEARNPRWRLINGVYLWLNLTERRNLSFQLEELRGRCPKCKYLHKLRDDECEQIVEALKKI